MTTYTIVKGDTLYKIAQEYDTTVAALEAVNPGINPMDLQIGKVIQLSSHHHPHPVPTPPPTSTPVPVSSEPPVLPSNTSVGNGAEAVLWANAILAALNAPVNDATTASMVGWFMRETGQVLTFGATAGGVGENNPLDVTPDAGNFAGTTGTEPSGAGPSHPGNYNFDTPADGIAATVEVITGQYPVIAEALISGAGLIGNSSVSAELLNWSGNGYSTV